MITFNDFIKEAFNNEVTIAWGRFNPPTIGHEKVLSTVKKAARGGEYRIYVSQSVDHKKNPLDYKTKVTYMRKMFPEHSQAIIMDASIKVIFDALVLLYNEGFRKLNLVAGSDRIQSFEKLLASYNDVKAKHGYYNFDKITVISSGERDPDSDGVEGMSASKLRDAVKNNNFNLFLTGIPSGFKDARGLFNDIRKGMRLSEINENFIKENTIVYRGVTTRYDDTKNPKNIIWVSTSEDHAKMYATKKGEVTAFSINKIANTLDLGFRSSETEVKLFEIISRIKDSILDLFERNKINEDLVRRLFDQAESIKISGYKKVYEWMYVPEILDIIKKAGFNIIRQNEGMQYHSGDIITYGILDRRLLKKEL